MAKANQRKSKSDEMMIFKDTPVSKGETNPRVLAESICVNYILMGGDDQALIRHMQFDHGFSFAQLEIGINEIRKSEGDCFENWESYFTKSC